MVSHPPGDSPIHPGREPEGSRATRKAHTCDHEDGRACCVSPWKAHGLREEPADGEAAR